MTSDKSYTFRPRVKAHLPDFSERLEMAVLHVINGKQSHLEHTWYPVFVLLLENLVWGLNYKRMANSPHEGTLLLLMQPELHVKTNFRYNAGNAKQAHRYRKPDTGITNLWRNNRTDKMKSKTLLFFEGKPLDSTDRHRATDMVRAAQVLTEAYEQVTTQVGYYYASTERDAERVIGVAMAGEWWAWAEFERDNSSTPAFESDSTLKMYMEDHLEDISRKTKPWSVPKHLEMAGDWEKIRRIIAERMSPVD